MGRLIDRRINHPQPVPVSRFSPAGHVQPPSTAPAFSQKRTSTAPPTNARTASSLKPLVHCPVCGIGSRRRQERNRHMLSHLPCWIVCSVGACSWRGDRRDSFDKHLWDVHQATILDGHGYQLYDPKPLVEGVVKGSISIGDAEKCAITEVKGMALVLSKQELLDNPSGRKGVLSAVNTLFYFNITRWDSREV